MREIVGENAFGATWPEGETLPTSEAIADSQRGRGERKRSARGWPSLTPTEIDVARMVCEGLANKGIAAVMFAAAELQAHLTHIYARLDIISRAQLVQLAADQREGRRQH